MNIQELETARYDILKIILLNNSCLGMVRQAGTLLGGALRRHNPGPVCNFPALAEAFGVPARAAPTSASWRRLDDLFETPDRPSDCSILREELVMPMALRGR
ncbi:hypothetical protein MASR2M17_16180 [Aminivibrio sp.]